LCDGLHSCIDFAEEPVAGLVVGSVVRVRHSSSNLFLQPSALSDSQAPCNMLYRDPDEWLLAVWLGCAIAPMRKEEGSMEWESTLT
jgi:hypothetical protein